MSALVLREFPLVLRFSASQDRDEDTHILRLAGLLAGLRWQGDAAYADMRRIMGVKALNRGERLTDKELSLLVAGLGIFRWRCRFCAIAGRKWLTSI